MSNEPGVLPEVLYQRRLAPGHRPGLHRRLGHPAVQHQVTPYLKVDAPAGAVIGVQTDHYDDGRGLMGIDQATVFNARATYVCAGGVQEFEALGWMRGTAVGYTIPAGMTHPWHPRTRRRLRPCQAGDRLVPLPRRLVRG
ncbi:hypothetical protein [Streptomyces europaeiscabiei]|uniref:hypothetical protein n=1 Tax=Streptomyces europaeiscabiei TaxID=146819 RepID=UPI0029B13E56|nr:hypothetical protein [Streptomyces europaeiscabiei]MDX3586268.1 hypothetical protein [Streptomyces europaeiscabiei]WUD30218.1 hypothetical protein OG858_01530 [Streptomyces europaeiscabiei]